MEHLDFELEIGEGRGRDYPVSVHSPAGETRGVLKFPFDDIVLENRLQAIQIALLSAGSGRRRVVPDDEKVVRDFGRELFDTLFTGDVKWLFDVSQREAENRKKGLRVKLHFQSPDLASLPWEFLYDPRRKDYVCLFDNTPLVRYIDLPQPLEPLTVSPPIRVLGMVASPNDLPRLDVERERARLERALSTRQEAGLIELHWIEGQTWRGVRQALLREGPWHVFHFIGHGGFDPNSGEGLLALCDEDGNTRRFKARDFGRLLRGHEWLRLVILNSCEGARGDKNDVFSSTASILVHDGIPAVLAMQYEITDQAAIELARSFYEAVSEGDPVDSALANARQAVCFELPDTFEWAVPVLYMRSLDGRLFDVKASGASVRPPVPTRVADPEPAPSRIGLNRSTTEPPLHLQEDTNAPPQPPAAGPKFCRRCGARRHQRSKFCRKCGTSF